MSVPAIPSSGVSHELVVLVGRQDDVVARGTSSMVKAPDHVSGPQTRRRLGADRLLVEGRLDGQDTEVVQSAGALTM